MFVCPNCGANIRFDPARQMLHCDYCDTELSPKEYVELTKADASGLTEQEAEALGIRPASQADASPGEEEMPAASGAKPGESAEEQYSAYLYTCPQCGGEILSDATTAVTFCSFCGASTILEGRLTNERKPSYIIPFRLTQEQAENAYQKTIKKALFAPKGIRDGSAVERFRGIYMPYWIYRYERKGELSGSGEKSHRHGDYIITKHYNVTAQVDAQYSGIAYDASSSFSDSLSEAIAPYDVKQSEPFYANYLSGFYADTSDVDSYLYSDDGKSIASSDLAGEVMKQSAFRKYNVSASSLMNRLNLRASKPELGMFPVWFLGVRSGNRISYAVVNGQTGKVAADIPIAFGKYLGGSFLLALPIFVLLNLFLTLTPTVALVVSMVLALISLLISNGQLNRIYMRETGMDDRGLDSVMPKTAEDVELRRKAERVQRAKTGASPLRIVGIVFCVIFILFGGSLSVFGVIGLVALYSRGKTNGTRTVVQKKVTRGKAPFREKLPTFLKPLISIGAALLVLLLAPAADIYYYSGAAACMAMVAWSFYDIIKEHNQLSTRKLPQFHKRGGDQYDE